MARLIIEDAAMAVGRPPQAIEHWILAGKVDAERAGDDWLVDLRSLLNAATAEDAAANGNGHAPAPAPRSPIQQPDDLGGQAAPVAEAASAVAVTAPPAAEPAPAAAPAAEPVAAGTAGEPVAAAPAASDDRTLARPESTRTGQEATVEIASTAIAALSARLEQAMSEIERLQDERLKLALQLGYAQAQLKSATDHLRQLAPPDEPNVLVRIWRRLFGRGAE